VKPGGNGERRVVLFVPPVGKAPADFEFCKRSIANPRHEFRLCHWLVRRLRKYRKTPRSSIDSLAVLECLASHLTPVFNAACDLKPHQASPPAFCLTRRSWPSSWRLVDAWMLGSEAPRAWSGKRSGAFRLFICLLAARHKPCLKPAHPSRRQKEKKRLIRSRYLPIISLAKTVQSMLR
jgi:hypothetical protein